jgi:plastocyanin
MAAAASTLTLVGGYIEISPPPKPMVMSRRLGRLFIAVGLPLLVACEDRRATVAIATHPYVAQARHITVTTVPLLVKEQQTVLPFLKPDFAKGGVLDGKEVYAFSPSSITVVEGDTVHFTFINPEDDNHSFVLPDFVVPLAPQKALDTTYVARHAGIFPIVCAVQSHLPMMSGQLVVLPAATMAGSHD